MMQIIPATTASTTSLTSSKDSLTVLVGNIPAKATELSLRQFLHGTLMQRGFCGVDHVPFKKITIHDNNDDKDNENDERTAMVECTTTNDRASTLKLHRISFQDTSTLTIEVVPEVTCTNNRHRRSSSAANPEMKIGISLISKEYLQLQVQELRNELAKTRIDSERTHAELNERAAAQLALKQELDATRAELHEARQEWQVEQTASQTLQKHVETQAAVEEVILGETREVLFHEQEANQELQQQLEAMELQTKKHQPTVLVDTITELHETKEELQQEQMVKYELQDRVIAQQRLLADAGDQILTDTEKNILSHTLDMQQSSKVQPDPATPIVAFAN
jgi:hypothetical protein